MLENLTTVDHSVMFRVDMKISRDGMLEITKKCDLINLFIYTYKSDCHQTGEKKYTFKHILFEEINKKKLKCK